MDNLALRYRPRTFDDLVGQREVQVILRQMVTKDRVPAALLFDGSRGTGKTTTARILAAALNCTGVESNAVPGVRSAHRESEGSGVAPRLGSHDRPCGACTACIATFDGSHLDVTEIDAASNGGVDNVRDLRQNLQYRSSGRYRVIIFDEAHSASRAAFDAMLKILEEPPPYTAFILLTTEPRRIPDTVASRCMPFTFRRLSITDIRGRLRHICTAENLTVDDDLATLIAERADGAMRDAIMLLDQVSRVGLCTAEQFQRLVGDVDAAPALLTALVAGDTAHAFALLDAHLSHTADFSAVTTNLISTLRDVLVLRCHGDITTAGPALLARQSLALSLDRVTVVAALKVLWELKTKMRLDDARSSLELAVVMLGEILAPPPSAPTPARPLSLTEMMSQAA